VDAVAAVLFVCTGNLCRSPVAAGLLSRRLTHDGPADVRVDSAGTLHTVGPPPAPLLAEAAAFGLDLEHHVPKQMTPDDISGADLVLGMTRDHVRQIVLTDLAVFGRTFTLRDFVRRAMDVGPRSAAAPIDEWLARVHHGRRHLDVVGESSQDDVADPMGGPAQGYRTMLKQVSSLTDALYTLTWGAAGG
jgi:protein-tyrosine phosphatase